MIMVHASSDIQQYDEGIKRKKKAVYMSKSADAVFADEAIKLLRVKLASRAPAHFVGAEACLVR